MIDRYIDGTFRFVLVELDHGHGPELLVGVPDEVEDVDAFVTDRILGATRWTEAFNFMGKVHELEE